MQQIIAISSIFILIIALALFIIKGGDKIRGIMPASIFTFVAILFTSGLDAGLVMLPLTEFPVYVETEAYSFTNPVAIEFGFWGFLVWAFYFVTTFYFIKVEPKVKLFEIQWVNILNNLTIIATCAFTAGLFLTNLNDMYLKDYSKVTNYLITFIVIAGAVFSSTKFVFIRILSVGSTFAFLALVVGMWLASGMGISGFANNMVQIFDYFPNIYNFVIPIDGTHEFYIMWWFCWSIMIGQFVAKFTPEMSVRSLLIAMLVIPSILLAIWFAVIYAYFTDPALAKMLPTSVWNMAMVVVAILFVLNSLDSLIRLYSDNLDLGIEKLGLAKYIGLNIVVLTILTVIYQYPQQLFGLESIYDTIKYVGIAVLFIYIVAMFNIGKNWQKLKEVTEGN